MYTRHRKVWKKSKKCNNYLENGVLNVHLEIHLLLPFCFLELLLADLAQLWLVAAQAVVAGLGGLDDLASDLLRDFGGLVDRGLERVLNGALRAPVQFLLELHGELPVHHLLRFGRGAGLRRVGPQRIQTPGKKQFHGSFCDHGKNYTVRSNA